MNLTKEQLQDVEQMAAAAMKPKEVAYALGLNVQEFIAALLIDNSDLNVHYYRGMYSNEFVIRKNIMQLARNGSSPAQSMAYKLIEKQKKSLLYEE